MFMKIGMVKVLGIAAVAGTLSLVGCDNKPGSTAGVGERTGAALDKAAEKTGEAVEKTGAGLQK
jgi:uncharacterized lipoprotein NlpE involved in copper resistance